MSSPLLVLFCCLPIKGAYRDCWLWHLCRCQLQDMQACTFCFSDVFELCPLKAIAGYLACDLMLIDNRYHTRYWRRAILPSGDSHCLSNQLARGDSRLIAEKRTEPRILIPVPTPHFRLRPGCDPQGACVFCDEYEHTSRWSNLACAFSLAAVVSISEFSASAVILMCNHPMHTYSPCLCCSASTLRYDLPFICTRSHPYSRRSSVGLSRFLSSLVVMIFCILRFYRLSIIS